METIEQNTSEHKTYKKFCEAVQALESVRLGSVKLIDKKGSHVKVNKVGKDYDVIRYKDGLAYERSFIPTVKFENNYRWYV